MTRAEPTHQQLLEALERLFQATEEQYGERRVYRFANRG